MGSPRTSWLAMVLAACGPTVGTGTGETGSASTGVADTSVGPTSGATVSTTTTGDTTTTTGSSTESGELESTTDTPGPDVPHCAPLSCDNIVHACTDGEDDDLDGLVDLLDPDCISVCDDDEAAFPADLPLGNYNCRWDCAFDGNTGQGDDGCSTDLRCDEEDPGALLSCDYQEGMGQHPSPGCEGWPPPQSAECRAFCEPFVLPGCDCFGCCTLATDDGPISFFLDGSPECGSDDLTGCQPCTPLIEQCGNACTPETCEMCFGETAPPEGCRANTCDNGLPCTAQSDCACGEMCVLGCCLPLPPG